MSYFSPENIPDSYVKISWQDRLERIPSDYGGSEHPYQSPYPPGDELETMRWWEEEMKKDPTITPIF